MYSPLRLGHTSYGKYFGILVMMLASTSGVCRSQEADIRRGITIPNLGPQKSYSKTNYNVGPSTGDILNNHYFPGVHAFLDGNFRTAISEFDYFLARPHYTHMNPRQNEYLSTALYMRGTVLLEHATGSGRHILAIEDFKASIHWNMHNYYSHLKLAKAFKTIGRRDEATQVLSLLLKLQPGQDLEKEAQILLAEIESAPH